VTVNQPDFADLFRAHQGWICRYFRYQIRDELLTEDLTAEVFERAYRNRERYDPRLSAFPAWLTRIAHNVVNDYQDREVARARHEAETADDLECLPSTEVSP
jgi:RNA polymerase sigma factor (sigma-70 family)